LTGNDIAINQAVLVAILLCRSLSQLLSTVKFELIQENPGKYAKVQDI
jgi:hypothetical protein